MNTTKRRVKEETIDGEKQQQTNTTLKKEKQPLNTSSGSSGSDDNETQQQQVDHEKKKNKNTTCNGNHDGEHGHSHGGGKEKQTTLKKKIINFTLLFLMVPLIYSLPFILKKAGEIVASNRVFLIYIWAFYLTILFGIVYMKKGLLSISSFVNQNLIWLIFTLGVFIVLDIPKMIQQVELRTEVLYVWITLTMIPNLVIFFLDDTDYKTQEKLEEEKEERKKKKDQERKARLDEKRKAKLDEKMKKYTPAQRRLINLSIYLVLTLLILLLGYQTYHWYLRTQRNIQERIKSSKSDYIHEHFDIED